MNDPLFTQRGGARRGSANYTWPFERLSVFKDRLILSETNIPKKNIEKLSLYNGIFTAGLRIDRKSNKELLVFWTLNFRALKDALVKAGYSVEV
jgi:deoxyadenosine/deoxycytidine kinase